MMIPSMLRQIQQVYGVTAPTTARSIPAATPGVATPSQRHDSLALSPAATLLSATLQRVHASGDVRDDVVARVRQRIMAGEYIVEPGRIRNALLKEANNE